MHYKQNKQSRTYVQGLRPFGNTLPRGLKGILKKNGYNYSEIISKWNILVGKDISDCAYPKSIKMTKGDTNGTLLLSVKRGDEITVEYSKRDIINKINSHFGYQLISGLRLQTFSKVTSKLKKNKIGKFSKNIEEKIDKIKNKNIRNSLYQLLDAAKNDKN